MTLKTDITTLANATGKDVIVGTRGHNGSWFAHCGGVEFDGSTPEMALRSLGAALLVEAGKAERAAKEVAQKAERLRQALRPTD